MKHTVNAIARVYNTTNSVKVIYDDSETAVTMDKDYFFAVYMPEVVELRKADKQKINWTFQYRA